MTESDILLVITLLRLDVFVHGNTLHHAPYEPLFGYHLLTFCNLLNTPHLAIGYVVQGVHYVRCSRLTDITQRYGVVGSVPTPRLGT